MPRAGFEHAISTFERPKTVLASDRPALETDLNMLHTVCKLTLLCCSTTDDVKLPTTNIRN
jgi:hypothetical protein